ncbi:MAG: phytase [Gammaproteobacteria bacterium]|nr:phytase [Gammaproteobacteria bacterium]
MKSVINLFAASALTACVFVPERLPYEVQQVAASVQTAPMPGRGDRADDPALWVHPGDAGQSLILGTDKAKGLYVYGLDGVERQRLNVGQVNNVDVRGSIAVASNRGVNGLSWFHIGIGNDGGRVSHIGDTPVTRTEPYGTCLGRADDHLLAGVTYKDGAIELWRATDEGKELPEVSLERTVMFDSQLEGCVFDDSEMRLFIGEEGHGIWVLDLSEFEANAREVDTIAAGNGLVADVEGLALYITPGGGYLIASAQRADRFVIYDRSPPYGIVGAFSVSGSADGHIDAVSHTDGIDISSTALPGFPLGVLIVQDDANPRSGMNQNFKIVDWRHVEAAIERLRAGPAAAEESR